MKKYLKCLLKIAVTILIVTLMIPPSALVAFSFRYLLLTLVPLGILAYIFSPTVRRQFAHVIRD